MSNPRLDTFSLRQVANLSGLSEFTLRGWEGRYQAFVPLRTQTGRRLYSKDHITRVLLFRDLTDMGLRIGDIANLSTDLLQSKIDETLAESASSDVKVNVGVTKVINMILAHDWQGLKETLSKVLHKQKPRFAIENIILPILSQVGMLVSQNRMTVAQEHILSALIKEQLYFMLSNFSSRRKNPKTKSVIVATPEGDFHEIGILIAHVILSSYGVTSLFLGINTPKQDLCETAVRFGATHILVGSTIGQSEGAEEDVFSYIDYLDQNIPQSVCFWFGGRSFEKSNLNLDREFKYFSDLTELPSALQAVSKSSKKRETS